MIIIAIQIIFDKDTSFGILVLLLLLCPFFSATRKIIKVIKFFLREHVFIWSRDGNLFL